MAADKRALASYRGQATIPGVCSVPSRGADSAEYDTLREKVAIGSQAFRDQVKGLIKQVSPEQPDRRFVRRDASFDQVVKVVEQVKGERWSEFRGRRGGWGRALVLYLARERSGLTLRELGAAAGGMNYKTVAKCVERFANRIQDDRQLARIVARSLKQLSNIET